MATGYIVAIIAAIVIFCCVIAMFNRNFQEEWIIMIIFVIFVAIFAIAFGIGTGANATEEKEYKEKYPLNTTVEIIVDREKMNDHYDTLSAEEKEVLEISEDKDKKIYLTRETENILIITTSSESDKPIILRDKSSKNSWINTVNRYYIVVEKDE